MPACVTWQAHARRCHGLHISRRSTLVDFTIMEKGWRFHPLPLCVHLTANSYCTSVWAQTKFRHRDSCMPQVHIIYFLPPARIGSFHKTNCCKDNDVCEFRGCHLHHLPFESHSNFLSFLWPERFLQFHDSHPYILCPFPALRSWDDLKAVYKIGEVIYELLEFRAGPVLCKGCRCRFCAFRPSILKERRDVSPRVQIGLLDYI